ncbi:unnamed protein product [Caenorhabditis brenneri]
MIMALHRLWSSTFTSMNDFWKKYWRHAYGLLVVVSGLLTIPNSVWGFNKIDIYDPEKNKFVKDPLEPSIAILAINIFMAKSLIFFVLIFFFNISTVYLIWKRVAHNSASPKIRTMMRNLSTIVFIHTTMYLIVLAWPITLSIFLSTMPEDLKYNAVMTTSDVNILCYLNTWISRLYHAEATLPLMVWVNYNFYFLFEIYYYFVTYFYHAQSLSVIIMSIHRLWSSKSTSGNEFWKKYWRHAYVLLLVVSGLLTIPNLLWGFNKPDVYDPEKKVFVVDPLEPSLAVLANNIFMAKSIIFFTLIFIINIWTVYLIRKRFAHNFSSLKIRTMMKNLTTIVFINTTLFFIVLTWPIHLSIFITIPEYLKYDVVMSISDVLSLSLPYILLACDRNVQASLHKYFGTISINTDVKKRQKESGINRRKTVITAH